MGGGLGHCGQELCCARLGGEFCPVSIRMAKEQNLFLNPAKISGICGRLLCCLKYENDVYVQNRKELNCHKVKNIDVVAQIDSVDEGFDLSKLEDN